MVILPWAAGFDEERLDTDPAEPATHVLGDKLGPVIRPNMIRRTMLNEEIGQAMEHIVRSEPACNDDRQASACELVDHGQRAKAPLSSVRSWTKS